MNLYQFMRSDNSSFRIFLLCVGALFQMNASAQNQDIAILREIHLNRNPQLDYTAKLFSNSVTPLLLGTPVVIYGVGILKHDQDLKKQGIFVAQSILVSTFVSAGLKYSIQRPRPGDTYTDIQPVVEVNTPSFPSGHTTKAFSLATSLSMAYPKWYVIAPSYLWAGSVAYSRMHLGVHYPTDVLAGIVIGSGSAFLTHHLNGWINRKYDKNLLYNRKFTSDL